MKYFYIVIICIFLINCFPVNSILEEEELIDPKSFILEDFENDLPQNFKTVKSILNYIEYTIEYKLDDGDYWQSPKETYTLKTGDCEDKAILFAYLVNKCFGYEPEIWLVSYDYGSNRVIHNVSYVYEKNILFGDLLGVDWERNIICKFTYNQAMYISTTNDMSYYYNYIYYEQHTFYSK